LQFRLIRNGFIIDELREARGGVPAFMAFFLIEVIGENSEERFGNNKLKIKLK
jgi:hypothetical protein